MTPPKLESIIIDGHSYPLTKLTEFGFDAPFELPGAERRGKGTLVLESQRIEVDFRVRRRFDGVSICTFVDFPITASEKVRKHLKRRNRGSGGLDDRSYDELASGIIDSSTESSTTAEASVEDDPQEKSYVKSFAMMALLLTMVGLVVLATVFLRSRSTLGVANSALVGNSIPVNSKAEGEIVEVLVRAGDVVRKGDVLVRLANPEILMENKTLSAQLATARSKVKSLEKQKLVFVSKVKFASQKLKLDREVALKELEAANKARISANAAYQRLVPYEQSGAVTRLELDEVENLYRSEESKCIAKKNLVKQIEFAQEAAKKNILIMGDRLDDELGKIQAGLEFAQAEVKELEQLCKLASQRENDLEVVAPRDGLIYVAYRQRGEFIKTADELVGLSYPGETWAAGQVSAAQASRVMPGQPVTISIPAMRSRLEGIVMAVGHRAMYSRGHYNAEFRGATATDVPVKVYIKDLPENIPSGIRLEMAINTGFGIDWLDESLGYELRPIGSQSKSEIEEEPSVGAVAAKLAAFPEAEGGK